LFSPGLQTKGYIIHPCVTAHVYIMIGANIAVLIAVPKVLFQLCM